MSKVRKNLLFTFFLVLFFTSFSTVEAMTCKYGKYNGNQWDQYLEIIIDDYDDYTLSFNSGLYKDSMNLEACDRADSKCKVESGDTNFYIDYVGYETVDVTNSIADFFGISWEGEEMHTFSFNLFFNEEIYDLYAADGYCPATVEICKYEEANSLISSNFGKEPEFVSSYLIFKDSLTQHQAEAKEWGLFTPWTSDLDCGLVLNEYSTDTGEYLESVTYGECATYNDFLTILAYDLAATGSCNDNEAFTRHYRELSTLCDNFASSENYTGTNNGQMATKSCMKSCSTLRDDISKLCKMDMSDSITENCNTFGERTLAWIFKIINMVRYLVPVILIILGILDFIKSIASDDEGEVKKAGARFVKRLIAAALVFIIPLILQFVLNIFNLPGLDPNNPFCAL